jgi:hypothetical protein
MSKLPSRARPRIERRVVINDSSCLIDLWKVRLLQDMLRLPYRFAVALPVQRAEVLDITQREWATLVERGFEVIDLDGSQVAEAIAVKGRHPGLSAADCFSLVLARSFQDAVLLTGDAQLRYISEEVYKLEVHGVLWVTDELSRLNLLPRNRLIRCLESWRDDPTVFLPAALIAARLRALR